MPAFHVLCAEANQRIIHYCDMPTLLKIRATCHFNYTVVRQELDRSLRQALKSFVPDVDGFINALHTNQSFVGGSVAISFLARDVAMAPANLDVFVPRDRGFPFLFYLLDYQRGVDLTVYPKTEEEEEVQRKGWVRKGVWQIYHVSTPNGVVNVYVSVDTEALVPIACSWATHLTTYVGPHHFGTSCPQLFFARRGILGGPLDADHPEKEIAKYMRRGFDFRMYPTQWQDLHLLDCGASQGLCPTQARHFDDEAALCARFQPLQAVHLDPTVVWRMDGRPCGGDCHRDWRVQLAGRCKWYVSRVTRRAWTAGVHTA